VLFVRPRGYEDDGVDIRGVVVVVWVWVGAGCGIVGSATVSGLVVVEMGVSDQFLCICHHEVCWAMVGVWADVLHFMKVGRSSALERMLSWILAFLYVVTDGLEPHLFKEQHLLPCTL